jgi:oxygen-dependent protoporphyrinogen oxidase
MKVIILGGGISGLSAAYYLLKKHPSAQVTLFEKSARLGGWIDTTEVDGFLFERGPRTFQAARCPLLLQMIQDLGLEKELIYSAPETESRYLWHRGKLRKLGSFWLPMLGALCKDLFAPKGDGKEETIYEFGCRRLGKKATELFLGPMTTGVHGGDMRKLSMQSSFPLLHSWEQREGSLFKAALKAPKSSHQGLFTLRSGLKSLIHALSLLPIEKHLNTSIEKLLPDGVIAGGQFFAADKIISALPAPEISRLTEVPLCVRYESMSVVNLGFNGDVLPYKGYGYLVPATEKEALLGMIWDSALFPTQGQTKLTAMVRSSEPLRDALEAIERHLKIKQQPAVTLVTQAEIPQCKVGHLQRVQKFEQEVGERYPKVSLVGNYLRAASVEGCLSRSEGLWV